MRRNFTLKTVAKEASTTKEDASRHEPQTIAIDVASRKELQKRKSESRLVDVKVMAFL